MTGEGWTDPASLEVLGISSGIGVIATNGPDRLTGCSGNWWKLGPGGVMCAPMPLRAGEEPLGAPKFGGSLISPPISKPSLSAASLLRLYLRPQNTTRTPARNAAEIPDATDSPITAGDDKGDDCEFSDGEGVGLDVFVGDSAIGLDMLDVESLVVETRDDVVALSRDVVDTELEGMTVVRTVELATLVRVLVEVVKTVAVIV